MAWVSFDHHREVVSLCDLGRAMDRKMRLVCTLVIVALSALLRPALADHYVYIRNPETGQIYAVHARSPGESEKSPSLAEKEAAAGVTNQRSARASASLRFMAWRDPAENAFTVDVPKGWRITGGTTRSTRIEPHYVVRATAPDGGATIFWDDPRLLLRQTPNAYTQRLGLWPGRVIPSAWGGRLLIENYEPAANAALEYARQFLCRRPTNIAGGRIVEQSRALAEQFGPIAQAEGKQLSVDAGEVQFRCGDHVGYVYAVTLAAMQPGSPAALWLYYRLGGYMATSSDSAAASAGIHEMMATFRMNPQWLQAFARESNDMAGNVIRESNAVTQTTIRRAQAQDREMASEYKAWHARFNENYNAIARTNSAITGDNASGGGVNGHGYNAQLDTKTVCDSVGHCQSVDATITNWWFDCSGTAHPGPASGAPPSSSLSGCWQKGR